MRLFDAAALTRSAVKTRILDDPQSIAARVMSFTATPAILCTGASAFDGWARS